MITDAEKALIDSIKECIELHKSELSRRGLTVDDLFDNVRENNIDDIQAIEDIPWLLFWWVGIRFAIDSMKDRRFDRVLLGIKFVHMCLPLSREKEKVKSIKTLLAKANAAKRIAKDPKKNAMDQIEKLYLEKWNSGYRFPHGRLKQFYAEMAEKNYGSEQEEIKLDQVSIKNRIEKLRKELGHSQKPLS